MSLFNELAGCFAEAAVDYVLIGGHAVNVWAEPRFTADIDFTVRSDPDALGRLRALLEADGWTVERVHGEGLPSGPDFVRFVHPDHDSPVELQTAKTGYQQTLIERAVAHEDVGGLTVATPEDLLVLKLIAFRAKDRGDLAALAALDGLDWPYVERWAAIWEVEDRLRRIRAPE